MSGKIQEVLNEILTRFENGDLPEALCYSIFPVVDTPCRHWSLLNRMLMFWAGTSDARGFRQWQTVNRRVKKGAKAVYILVPRFVKRAGEQDSEKEEVFLSGFMVRPVFRLEDTEGEPLAYEKLSLPNLPLLDRAKEWGVSVKAVSGSESYYGYFSPSRGEIALASPEESVFFHELAHAAASRIRRRERTKPNKKADEWREEIMAELSAAVLCRLVGKTSRYLGNHYGYIRHYAETAGLSPVQACLRVLRDVERVLALVLDLNVDGETVKSSKAPDCAL